MCNSINLNINITMYVVPGVLKNGTIYNNQFYQLKTIHSNRLVKRGWFLVEQYDNKGRVIILDFIPSYIKPLPNFLKSRRGVPYDEIKHYEY